MALTNQVPRLSAFIAATRSVTRRRAWVRVHERRGEGAPADPAPASATCLDVPAKQPARIGRGTGLAARDEARCRAASSSSLMRWEIADGVTLSARRRARNCLASRRLRRPQAMVY